MNFTMREGQQHFSTLTLWRPWLWSKDQGALHLETADQRCLWCLLWPCWHTWSLLTFLFKKVPLQVGFNDCCWRHESTLELVVWTIKKRFLMFRIQFQFWTDIQPQSAVVQMTRFVAPAQLHPKGQCCNAALKWTVWTLAEMILV